MNNKMRFEYRFRPLEWNKDYKSAIFFFDEGEQMIERRMFNLTNSGGTGLCQMRTRYKYFFSATLNEHWK